jgi:TusA-related sulfurtransferase
METQDEFGDLTVDSRVDARRLPCPGPLLEAKRGMATVPLGGVLEVLSSDAGTARDLPRWAARSGHEHLGTVEEAGYWRIFVKRMR